MENAQKSNAGYKVGASARCAGILLTTTWYLA